MKICVSCSPRLIWITGSIDPWSVLEDLGTFFSQLCLSLGRQYLPAIPYDAPAAIYSDTLEDTIRCWVMSAYPKRERAFWAQAGYRENQLAWLRCLGLQCRGSWAGRDKEGHDSSLKRYKRNGWSQADEIQQLWCKHTMEKQQPSSLGSKSQLLQLFAVPLAWPSQTLYWTHGCEVISSRWANLQKRLPKGLELKCINDYSIPNSPRQQLWQQNITKQHSITAQTPQRGWHATPFSFRSMGEAKSLHCKLLSVHIYPPSKSWTQMEVKGQKMTFFISTSRFHLTQQPLSPVTPLLGPHTPLKHTHESVLTNTPFICECHMLPDSMPGERFKQKIWTACSPGLFISFCFIYQKYINPKACFHQSLDSMNI